jgi:Flp pilus assembly protein TadD
VALSSRWKKNMRHDAYHRHDRVLTGLILLLLTGLAGCRSNLPAPALNSTTTATPATSDAQTYNDQGLECVAKGDYDCALTHYDQAIRLKPDWAEPYNNRGLAYAARGDYGRALADTGRFQHRNTSPGTVAMACELAAAGADLLKVV